MAFPVLCCVNYLFITYWRDYCLIPWGWAKTFFELLSMDGLAADIYDIGFWLSGEGWGGIVGSVIITSFLWDLLSSADKRELNDIAERM